MAAWPSPWLPLLLVAALFAFEDWLFKPSCSGGSPVAAPASGDLRAMIVADLMLLGSDATYVDSFFRVHLMSKFITKSIQTLNPDMIIVLGDISAKGSDQTESKWISVIEQLEKMLGRYSALPLHITLGDKDVGGCVNLDAKFVHHMAKHLPGLDSSGCGTFEISNVSFMSLNSVALLCGDNSLRFSVEKVMERESHHFRRKIFNEKEHGHLGSEKTKALGDPIWRQNNMKSGSGPVVLLHIPLHKSHISDGATGVHKFSEGTVSDHPFVSPSAKRSDADGRKLYDQLQTLPANSSEYILQALKPRIIFSAHADSFSDYTHVDGTQEVAIPAMTWKAIGRPGFVIATFGPKEAVAVDCCSLAQECSCNKMVPVDVKSKVEVISRKNEAPQAVAYCGISASAMLECRYAAFLETPTHAYPYQSLMLPTTPLIWLCKRTVPFDCPSSYATQGFHLWCCSAYHCGPVWMSFFLYANMQYSSNNTLLGFQELV